MIIGASGTIGKKLKKNLKNKYKLITPKRSAKFDITQIDTMQKYFNNSLDAVINLSGQMDTNSKMYKTIIKGNQNLIKLSSKLKKKIVIIYLSSNLVYGYSNKILNEKSKTQPYTKYAKYKLTAEKCYQKTDLNYHIFRLGNIYGEIKREKNIISNIYNSILNKNKLYISNINVYRNFISVDDLVRIVTKSLSVNLKHQIYNIGNENLNLKKIILYFESVFKKEVKFIDQGIKITSLSSQKINTSKILIELNMRLKNKMYNYFKNYKKKCI